MTSRYSSGLILHLIRDHRIHGNLIGTSKENSIFYPKVYTDAQAKYIESFFAQNGYIEYSLVRNLGINDPEGQTKLVLKDRQQILFLISGCIDLLKFLPQLEMNIEQGLLSNDYVDLTSLVPNSFNEHDVDKLLKAESSIKELIQSSGGEQISNTFVISKELQEKIEKKLNQLCQECVEKVRHAFLADLSLLLLSGICALHAATLRCGPARQHRPGQCIGSERSSWEETSGSEQAQRRSSERDG